MMVFDIWPGNGDKDHGSGLTIRACGAKSWSKEGSGDKDHGSELPIGHGSELPIGHRSELPIGHGSELPIGTCGAKWWSKAPE